ncbi:hypothetical protein HK405_012731, partial [Cladochytrium tenue]
MKTYSGVTAYRLEQIEFRLKEDITTELRAFDNKVLVHVESDESKIVAKWEDCLPQNVLTLREVIESLQREDDPIELFRVPVTAEEAPDDTDYDCILQILSKIDLKDTAIVVGVEVRQWVDETIDQCSTYSTHLRDVIEKWRLAAEGAENEQMRRRAVRKGLASLRRYFGLIAFGAYLTSVSPDELGAVIDTFRQWMGRHKEFATMLEEMERGGLQSLVPVEHLSPGDGIALTTEVLDVVNSRDGAVLAKQTILKADIFPGAQKPSLLERVEGAPNYRKISLLDLAAKLGLEPTVLQGLSVYGIGMPTVEAIRTALNKVGAGKSGPRKVLWTSLREEPVIYIKGKPYILRLFQDPLKNLEITGITEERVAQMEEQMVKDCIAEPVWETVSLDDIKTPLQVYQSITAEGYRVDYKRIPMFALPTDEQAPIPVVFDQLVKRLDGFSGDTDAIFNCQMGRGRTTTGIVTACILKLIVGNEALLDSASEIEAHPSSSLLRDESPSETDSERTSRRYLAGEYKMVL